MDWTDVIKTLLTLILGGGGTVLAQKLRTKPEKQKEQTSADRERWELWEDQTGWFKTELRDLRQQCAEQSAQIGTLSRKLSQVETTNEMLEAKHTELELRQTQYEAHLDDVYAVISSEPDGGKNIFSKVTTQRPAKLRTKQTTITVSTTGS